MTDSFPHQKGLIIGTTSKLPELEPDTGKTFDGRCFAEMFPPIDKEERATSLNAFVDILVLAAGQTPYTWEEVVSCFFLAAVKVLRNKAPIKGRRNRVISALVSDLHKKLNANLPF